MRILLIKMSSMGDVVHALPALTDAARQIPGLEVDWVVEEGFKNIPAWHPAVKTVIPIAWRRWRKQLFTAQTWREMRGFFTRLRLRRYDVILDAQGLIKSACVARLAHGRHCGMDAASAREALAAWLYARKMPVARGQHAVVRLRQLFARCLDYAEPQGEIDYGIGGNKVSASEGARPYLVFVHGTTWKTKLWPEQYWRDLGRLATAAGYEVLLPWGTAEEQARAQRIADGIAGVRVLDRLSLNQLRELFAGAAGIVGVDTGLSHVAAALNIPLVAIYGATDPQLTGVLGPNVAILTASIFCSPCLSQQCRFQEKIGEPFPPCYQDNPARTVWKQLRARMGERRLAATSASNRQ